MPCYKSPSAAGIIAFILAYTRAGRGIAGLLDAALDIARAGAVACYIEALGGAVRGLLA